MTEQFYVAALTTVRTKYQDELRGIANRQKVSKEELRKMQERTEPLAKVLVDWYGKYKPKTQVKTKKEGKLATVIGLTPIGDAFEIVGAFLDPNHPLGTAGWAGTMPSKEAQVRAQEETREANRKLKDAQAFADDMRMWYRHHYEHVENMATLGASPNTSEDRVLKVWGALYDAETICQKFPLVPSPDTPEVGDATFTWITRG